jgi:uncharacterized protein
MRWLVDGYNVIRRDPELAAAEGAGLDAGRASLLALLARVAQRTSETFTVVFDGARRSGGTASAGRVSVLFSRPPDTADDVLRRLAASLRDGAVVVTSDRAVLDAARRAGAVAVTAEAFVAAARGGVEEGEGEDEDDDEAEAPSRSRGPARRPSREARAAARVLRRLAGR